MDNELVIALARSTFSNRFFHPDEIYPTAENFFANLAEQIMRDFQPASVLDVGFNNGLLVEHLHRSGIQARELHSNDAEHEQGTSILTPFEQTYDLIICLEALNNLPEQDHEAAIRNLCQYTEEILFSATPYPAQDTANQKPHSPAYWASLFAKHSFLHDLSYPALPHLPWSMRFRKHALDIEIISSFEHSLWQLREENHARRAAGLESRFEITQLLRRLAHITALRQESLELYKRTNQELIQARAELTAIYNSRSWKATQFVRKLLRRRSQ